MDVIPMRRTENHEAATAKWGADNALSRVAGLGERLRAEKSPRPYRAGRRASEQKALRQAQANDRADALRSEPYRAPESRYWPHQSEREMARRVRQMGARANV